MCHEQSTQPDMQLKKWYWHTLLHYNNNNLQMIWVPIRSTVLGPVLDVVLCVCFIEPKYSPIQFTWIPYTTYNSNSCTHEPERSRYVEWRRASSKGSQEGKTLAEQVQFLARSPPRRRSYKKKLSQDAVQTQPITYFVYFLACLWVWQLSDNLHFKKR